jgi:type II secretory pathway predicted ATPase ExeA
MFLDFYKMKLQPFGVTPDPRFLYLGQSHREALASLYCGIESDRGFVALIAPPGLGKTTLTFQLLEKLKQDSRSVFVFQTQCNSKELMRYLLDGLGVDSEGLDLVSMHNKLNQILCREMLAGRRFVLAIDEAQNLDPAVLETIRLLSNFETSQNKMLQILLVGQPQLAKQLARPELEQLKQRIAVFARLEPFGSEEISRYIAHRLQVAGYVGSPLFTPEALRLIAENSKGIPRKINILCFSALSLSFAMGRREVDAAIMAEVIADLDLESLLRASVVRRVAQTELQSSPAISTPIRPQPAPSSPVAIAAELPSQVKPSTASFSPAPASPALSLPAAPNPVLVSPVAPSFTFSLPVPPHSTLSCYSAKSSSSFCLWAIGATCLAAFVAVAIGIFTVAPGRTRLPIPESTAAWEFIRDGAATARSFIGVKSHSVALSSSLNVQAAELSSEKSAESFSSSHEAETNMAVVQPGETLRQIILRTVGEYNSGTIDQIEKLNPDIADFGHLEAGQTIRLQQVSPPLDSAVVDGTGAAGKN